MNYSAEVIGKLIRLEREKRKWTQKKLGEALNVSGKQISNYEQGEPIPPIDVLLKLCEVFDCELGYILGEEDYTEGSKIRTAICNVTGLSAASIDAIQKITGTARNCIEFGYESEKYRSILNKILISSQFIEFINNLGYLDDRIAEFNNIDKQLVEKLGNSLLNKALSYYSSSADLYNETDADKLKPEFCEAMVLLDSSIDKKRDINYQIKIARYELREAFEFLINDIYPRQHE